MPDGYIGAYECAHTYYDVPEQCLVAPDFKLGGVLHFFAKHDDRKGHHYYTRLSRPVEPSCIVVMTLAVIMGGGILHKNETHPKLGVLLHCQVCCAMMTQY